MDGYELAGELRARLASAPRLIALTGYSRAADEDRASSAGLERFLVKPVPLKQLRQSIEDMFGARY